MTDTHTEAARDAQESGSARDARGRFQPGHSGNPAGKKPGTLNHATRLKLLLADEAYDVMARRMIDAATEGHMPSIRFLMERLVPKPRGRAIALDLPPGASRAERRRAIVDLMCAGEISAEEAKAMIRVLDEAGEATSDLHPACKSDQAMPAGAPARDPAPGPRDGAGTGADGAVPLHSACISPPGGRSPVMPGPDRSSPVMTARRAAA